MPVAEDIYKQDVDFTALALQYPDFSKRLKSNRQLDFSDPESVRQLTKALLHRDFELTIDLPDDRLCPPVPNRFNYILFAHRLVDSTPLDYGESNSTPESLIGLDIGTGASAIYPMLACQQRASWHFLVTEIDAKSRSYAERNVSSNGLQSRIKFVDIDASGQQLIPTSYLQKFDDFAIRIQITNPPFYSSQDEMVQSAKAKSRPPNSACTGAPVEMITPGGEVSFVSRLIMESASEQNRTKIQWFSSMLGKLSSVTDVVEQLRKLSCTNYAVTEFIQGQKTRRWCVAWSWLTLRPLTSIARGIPALDKKFLPVPSDFEFGVQGYNVSTIDNLLHEEISKLDLQWRKCQAKPGGIGRSLNGDVWSRRARRRKQQDEEMKDSGERNSSSSDAEQEPALVFRISVESQHDTAPGTISAIVHIRWLQGQDAVIYESFCGWLKRKAGG